MSPPQGTRAAANPPLWAQPQPSASGEAAEFTGQESQWHLLFVQKSLLELHGETGEEIDACKLCVFMKGAGGGCLSKMPGGSAMEKACASCPPRQDESGAAQRNESALRWSWRWSGVI